MSLPDIRALVPHAGRMVLLDRLVSVGEESLCAEIVIGERTVFCDGQGVGAWIGVEYMAQAVAAFAGYEARLKGSMVKVGFFLGTRSYESDCHNFTVGSRLHVFVQRALQGENGLGAFECRIEDAEAGRGVLAKATITVFQPDDVQEFLQGVKKGSA
ncbi:ApeP family dehydratase [Oxalicibacterium solurbis]|uniref:3-hydroxylacyl-ACP dehydratase n=1 Tax=Oxalicibacterium solurbis TaxID=69280 RepID=A0A8J3AVB6_9BURK|nr:3-hydroxylacyl-ACP dehydratase [Oxalicibacterium solurbis]GGI54294.1 3-hydroxylacyl-ACP dehydratase [Oxalicibacterium solurbis]